MSDQPILGAPTDIRVVTAVGVLAHVALASAFLGTILMAAVAEYLYMRSHNQFWLNTARIFSVIAAIFFGVGAAFGTLVEFGLVTLWSNFISVIGEAIVLPFYLELFAFLTEVIILPLYVFTWGKMKNQALHWVIGIAAAFGGYWSAYNILAVMASLSMAPPGLEVVNLYQATGQNVVGLTDYVVKWASPADAWNMFWWGANVFIFHGILAAVIFSWSVIGGIYLYLYVRDRKPERFAMLRVIVPTVAVLTAIQGFVLGHVQGELVLSEDPLKLAALEGMFWSGLRVDPLTSFLAYGTLNHAFWGYYSWPAYMRPPDFVFVFYWVFMVIFGILLGIWSGALSLWYLFPGYFSRFGWARSLASFFERSGWVLIPFFAAFASIGGAVSAESGRYPFILVSSQPNPNGGPPIITGVPVGLGGLMNPTIYFPVWLAALVIIVEIAMPALAVYMSYLYLTRKPKVVVAEQY
ncbi:cytochrome ubiquinol oxidase subunit I [Vulcanisaeta thermophila]|uniref:cytochrome ubiquinol oxidase subunit I n=1 Tax=Vulcanisaeta thermophila TaxID=867917 RepID=UPI0008536869|nr:cytochrome ubiquinol oxidase subunit I [Vulcanisaeta thermophila]